jgi:hypothetical protein
VLPGANFYAEGTEPVRITTPGARTSFSLGVMLYGDVTTLAWQACLVVACKIRADQTAVAAPNSRSGAGIHHKENKVDQHQKIREAPGFFPTRRFQEGATSSQ